MTPASQQSEGDPPITIAMADSITSRGPVHHAALVSRVGRDIQR